MVPSKLFKAFFDLLQLANDVRDGIAFFQRKIVDSIGNQASRIVAMAKTSQPRQLRGKVAAEGLLFHAAPPWFCARNRSISTLSLAQRCSSSHD
jgi:hypothetical protein